VTPLARTFARRKGGLATALALLLVSGGAVSAQDTSRQGAIGSGPEIRAQLTPREYTTLSSEIAARIDRIATRVGEHFKQGDVLVEFDCVVPRAQMARADAVMQQSEKAVAINQRLLQLKSIGSLELEVSQAELAKAKADLAIARATVSKCTIAAPFPGVTAEQKAREFQYVAPGQPLLDVLDDHALEVELIAPSRWLSWLKIGSTFKVQIEETGHSYSAKVTRLGGRVDPVSQSIKVIGEITDPAPELMAGMSGQVMMAPPPNQH
jgi:membrane fusion protein (multidrug efflux system)